MLQQFTEKNLRRQMCAGRWPGAALSGDSWPNGSQHLRGPHTASDPVRYLRSDAAALAWLNGSGPRSVMESEDQWQLSVP